MSHVSLSSPGVTDDETTPGRGISHDEWTVISEGLAVFAIALVGLGTDEATCRHAILRHLDHWDLAAPTMLRAAADSIKSFPQPIDERPEEIERAKPVRDLMGVPSAEAELLESIAARELLQRLADELSAE
jgi:hypothetical protein